MRYSRLTQNKQANSATSQMFQFIRELTMIYADDRDENHDPDSLSRRLNFNDRPVYKSFEFIDNTRELTGFEENDSTRFRSQREAESFMSWNDLLSRAGFHINPATESEGSKTRRKIFVKRDAEDYNMPEMVAFFEDTNYHLFKDIFMDSEFQHVGEDDNKNEQNQSKKLLIEEGEVLEDETDDLIKHEYENKQHNSSKLIMIEGEDFCGRDNVRIAKKICHNNHQIMEIPINEAALSSSLSSSTAEAEHYKCPTSDACLTSEEKNSINSNTESGLIEVVKEAVDHDLEIANIENGMSSERLKRSNQRLNGRDYDGEFSSPEADDPPSGPISIRSNSSNSSSYSFAFPILASEWPGSPAKIANADKLEECPPTPIPNEKQLRRQSRWRLLICCKSIGEE